MLLKNLKLFGIAPIYLLYWTAGAIMTGMIIAQYVLPIPNQASVQMDHSMHEDPEHEALHEMLVELDPAMPPDLRLEITKDAVSGWNLFVDVENFTFVPASEGAEAVLGEGHAHLYVNDVKMARLYGPHFHMPDLPTGEHRLRVTLNANNHASYAVNGQAVAVEALLVQPEMPAN
ncbi:MAG: hypothetical protein AAF429_09350 [Pseudomonadota bacterium]